MIRSLFVTLVAGGLVRVDQHDGSQAGAEYIVQHTLTPCRVLSLPDRTASSPGRTLHPVAMGRFDPPSPAPAAPSQEPEGDGSNVDPRLITVNLDRNTGIDFGSDISLRWPYVFGLNPDGSAARLGLVDIGDQLVAVDGNLIFQLEIGSIMEIIAAVEGSQIQMTFFKGSREELQELVGATVDQGPVYVTVQQPGKEDVVFEVPYGANLRDELISRGINVYQSINRWTNCNGKELCGTCVVDVVAGIQGCTRRSIDEANKLRNYADTFKFACQTKVYGNVTIRLKPKIDASQIVGR
jgi:ferredoxin